MICKKCSHCCKGFTVYERLSKLRKYYFKWKNENNKSYIDINIIYPMLIPLSYDRKTKFHKYNCKHLSKKGLCKIQNKKPDMCKMYYCK